VLKVIVGERVTPWSIFVVIFSVILSSAALANSPNDVSNAVVMVAVRGKDVDGEQVQRNGTGFIVATSQYVMTAFHVVAPPPKGWGKKEFDLPDVTIAIRFRDPLTGLMTEVRNAHVHRNALDQDAALLQFDGLPRKGLSTCASSVPTVSGTQLMIAGVPNSAAVAVPKLELYPGLLNESQAQDGGLQRVAGQTMPGFSGGPVLHVKQPDVLQPIGILKGGQSFGTGAQSLYVPFSAVRGSVLAHCTAACRDETHGVERYDQDRLGQVHQSDWQRGGSTSDSYCGSYRSAEMNANPGVDVSIETHTGVGHRFFTGWRGNDYIVREAQYKYSCQLRFRSGPTYNLALTPRCAAPPNPNNLPN
jgi:hypothetical protein